MSEKKIIRSFEDLECWKARYDLMVYVNGIIKKFPPEAKYDTADNMRRASHSALRNIAEGFGRFHFRENAQFCRVSRGSLHELMNNLIVSRFDKYIDREEFEEGKQLVDRAIYLTNGYIRYLVSSDEKKKAVRLP